MSSREGSSAEPLVEPLTRREREILGLLAQGHSAPEIAGTLTLALSSVKWYIQQVYGKLGVNSKQRALLRATELGLLAGASDSSSPAPEPQPAARHNLPLQVTQFFGREAEIAQLKMRLSAHRLVTLAGSGGVGKTRLSLQVAEDLLENFADGVWFIALASLADPALVPQTIAATLRVRAEPGETILEALTRFLGPRQALLVLDNCEHLLEACAQLADHLLRACPRLKILASSREPLGVEGEAVFAVSSLPFPAAGQTPDAGQLAVYPAVQLFTDRVHLTQPDYAITPKNAAAVARICQRLDGIPLALELAAARLRLLDAETLAARLEDAFGVLTGGSRTALPRQQTLRATMDWSYRLLTDGERLLLQRLSVFAGGCPLEAAEAVCSGEGIETNQVLTGLAALVDKSMVNAERKPDLDPRYFLLETVRQYAREKLNDSGDSRRLHRRHRDYFLWFCETNGPRLQTREQPAWQPKFVSETDNLRQAIDWSFGDADGVEATLRLLSQLGTNIYGLALSDQEGADWSRRALALCESHPEIPAHLRVKTLQEAAATFTGSDPRKAIDLYEQAVALSRSQGPALKETLMWCLFHLARHQIFSLVEVEQGAPHQAEAEAILEELGPAHYAPEEGLRAKGLVVAQRARLELMRLNYSDAIKHSEESIRLYEASGSSWFAFAGHTHAGVAYVQLERYLEARAHFLAALNMLRDQLGWGGEYLYSWLGVVDLKEGNLEGAAGYGREYFDNAPEPRDSNMMAFTLGLFAAISARQGHTERAARLAGASAAIPILGKRTPWDDYSLDAIMPGWRDRPERDQIVQAYASGQAMSADEAVAYALSDNRPTPT